MSFAKLRRVIKVLPPTLYLSAWISYLWEGRSAQKSQKKFFFGQNPSTTSPDMGLKGGMVKKSLAVALAAVSKGHTSKRAVFGGKKFRLWEATKWLSFGIFDLKFGMDPWFHPYFWLLEKKIGAGLLLLNKPVPTCQIFEAKVIGLATHGIQFFSQNLMDRWVMSVQYEFDQFRKWNFWNGGQKTEKTLKNGIVLTLIIIFFSCFIKWLGNLRNGFPTPENVLLDPRITWMGQKKQNLGSPARSGFFPKWTFSVFWLFLPILSLVNSGKHLNGKLDLICE